MVVIITEVPIEIKTIEALEINRHVYSHIVNYLLLQICQGS